MQQEEFEDDIAETIAPQPMPEAPKSPAPSGLEMMRRLFDPAYYAAQTGSSLPPGELFAHFLEEGAAAGLSPHPDFDAAAYVQLNPDLPRDPLKAFEHYAKHGRTERRYASLQRITADVGVVQRSGKFDHDFYMANQDIDLTGYGNAIVHYLTRGWKAQRKPNSRFDQAFYLKYYPDAEKSLLPPFVHYLLELQQGRERYQNEADAQRDLPVLDKSGMFDAAFYKDRYRSLIPANCDARIHFLTAGQVLQLDGSQQFSTRFYVRTYPDLRALVRPFLHYALHGHNENRFGTATAEATIVPGRIMQDPSKQTVMLTLHEATRTGAPILGYNLARHLARQFNVVVLLLKGGALEQDLATHAVAVVKAPASPIDMPDALRTVIRRFQIDFAVLNSAVCHPISPFLYELKLPIVSLVHEFRDYTLPRGNLAKLAMFSDRVICPAPVVSNSLKEECLDYLGWVPSHIETRHQGFCQLPPLAASTAQHSDRGLPLHVKAALEKKPGRTVILGAGTVHMRKGVELFIQVAQMYKETRDPDALFIWVGGGFTPKTELFYSVWLQSQVELSDLKDTVIFADEARSLEPFYECSDVFFMSSRLDPFPNVTIDASMAGLPIVAFQKATGFADAIAEHPALGRAVPAFNLVAAVEALHAEATARHGSPKRSAEIRDLAHATFDFKGYAEFIGDLGRQSIANAEVSREGAKSLESTGGIDQKFLKSGMINGYLNQLFDADPAYLCIDLARKGIFPLRARPGSNLANQVPEGGDVDLIVSALRSGAESYDHPVHYLRFPANGVRPVELSATVAAHVHAYETDGVMDILLRLGDSPVPVKIYVTSDKDEKIEKMQDGIEGFGQTIEWITTPNRGRDIGPFVCGLPDSFWEHELIGHFHVKASSHLDRQFTQQWKTFVYDHLLGGTAGMQQLFGFFETDPDLGLIFPEDPCQVGWTRNMEAAEELAARLGIRHKLPRAPEFPIGNMFWARSAAFAPLRALKLQWEDLPDEPVPADGTLLHALERLTPQICKLAGFSWATVHHPSVVRYTAGKA